jgi:transposase InsO family protein
VSERYSFIGAEKACSGFPVRRGCKLLEVSTSGYYAWRERPLSATAERRAEIALLAANAHAASDGTNGYRRVHRDLVEDGVDCSWQLVRRVMREQDLAGAQPAAYRVTTRQDPDAKAAPDLICRDFTSQEPGSKLCGDITYIRTWAGWAYLAVVIDFSTKMVVGWQISNRASAQLCVEALEMAHRNGHVRPDAIFHSDRGSQGGINWSSQHLDDGGVGWGRCGSGSGRFSCIGGRCLRRGVRRWRGAMIGSGSGRRSLVG